jgi:hypothetical protein
MKGESVEQLLCLRSWARSKIITLNEGMLREAIIASQIDDDEVMTYSDDDLIYLDSDDNVID